MRPTRCFPVIAIFMLLTLSACNKQTEIPPALHANGTQEVTDAELTTNVQRALIVNDQLQQFHIVAKSQKGDLLLTGTVSNQKQYDLATSISNSISGVHAVHNEIVIRQ